MTRILKTELDHWGKRKEIRTLKTEAKDRPKYLHTYLFSIYLCFSVYEHVESGKVILRWCGTDDMMADFPTKAIIGNKFAKFRIQIMGHTEEVSSSRDYSDPL